MIRVMIVDDSLLARNAIQQALEGDPQIMVVGTTSNGEEALNRMMELKPAVITCDMEMPVMDGVQTLMQVRSHHPHVRVIVLSSLTQPNSVKEQLCHNLGAFAVLAKPQKHSNLNAVENAGDLIQAIHNSVGAA